jgi:hypothetical protein
VRETLDEGYCDVSGRAGELNFVGMCPVPHMRPPVYPWNFAGSMGGVKVFAAQGTIVSLKPTIANDLMIVRFV